LLADDTAVSRRRRASSNRQDGVGTVIITLLMHNDIRINTSEPNSGGIGFSELKLDIQNLNLALPQEKLTQVITLLVTQIRR